MKIWIQKTIATSLLLVAGFASVREASAVDATEPNELAGQYPMMGIPLIDVLSVLEELTGRAIIRPSALPNPEIFFDGPEGLTRAELVLAIESVLSLNGIGVAPMGEKFVKVVDIGSITRESPELELGSLTDRAPSGHVISKLFRLEYLDSQTFQTQIQPFLNPGFSSIIPFENSNAVIVTDTVSNLQRLEYVVSEVDKPSRFNIEPKFYPLQFADATEVAQQIQRLIDDARSRFGEGSNSSSTNRNTTNRPGANTRTTRGPQGPNIPNVGPQQNFASQVGQSSEGSAQSALFGSNTAISSDERTNQIIVITEPSNHKFFDDIIAKFDVRADPATSIEVIRLKHAEAQIVQSILSELVSGETSTDTSDRSQANNNRNNAGGNNAGNNNAGNNNATQRGNQNANAGNANRTVTASSSGEDRETQFSNFMTIVSDERSNSLIVTGTKSDLVAIKELVDEIDVLLPQVRIEVVIIDVNLSKDHSRGSDVISAIWDDTLTELTDTDGNPISNRQVTLGGDDGGFNVLGLGLGGTSFRIEDGNMADLLINAVFNRAKGKSDVNVISVPTIVTTHNQEAKILVGQEEPFVSSTDTGLTSGGTSRSSVSFADVYVELTVTPLIGPNDIIQMTIEQKIDEVASRVNVGGNDTPIIGRREANSFISAKNGELVILGGLQKENLSKTSSSPAIIGDIPLIGKLFSSHAKENRKSELMVFIRPTIVRDTDEGETMAKAKLETSEQSESVDHFLKSGELDIDYQLPKASRNSEGKSTEGKQRSEIQNRVRGRQ